jgi:hypothetical protein
MPALASHQSVTIAVIFFIVLLAAREIATFRDRRFFKYILTPLVTAAALIVAFVAYGDDPRSSYGAFILWGMTSR